MLARQADADRGEQAVVDGERRHEATLRRHSYHPLRVRDIVQETADTRTFVLDVPDELAELYRYRPGQFCTVRLAADGTGVQRCYSMSSAPGTDEHLAVTVKRVPGGVVSNWLHDEVSVGDRLELMPPAGSFSAGDEPTPVLAFTGGSGITPVFSIIKDLLGSTDRPVRLLDANRDQHSIIFRTSLDALAAANPDRFAVRYHLDDEAGFLTADDVADFVGDGTGARVLVCGPAPFMDVVEAGVAAAGVPGERVAIERFVVADPAPTPQVEEPHAGGATKLVVTIRRQRHELQHVAGETILDATRRAALSAPFSCEQGNCATCMALVKEGTVKMRVNDALTPDEVEEGWVLTCQGIPEGPVVEVEYEDL